MPVGHEDHGSVPMAPTMALGCLHEALNFALGQIFPGPQFGVWEPLGRDCSIWAAGVTNLRCRFAMSCAPPAD